jgi:hypothetical protein
LICNGSQIHVTLLRRIIAIPMQRLGKQLLSLQRMLTKVIPVTTGTTDENYPSTKCLLFGASTPYFRTIRNKTGQIKGVDQRRNIRADQRSRSETQRQGRSKESIRDATSEGFKGADQRRNVRGDQRSRSETQRQRR